MVIGLEHGRVPADRLPERAAISVMTVAELRLGVLTADDAQRRARRLETLVLAERAFEPLPVTEEVAGRYAELVAALRADGRREPVVGALIAATAIAHGLTLYTTGETFAGFPGLELAVL